MRKKLFTFLLALVTSVGMSWAVPTEFANCYDCWRIPEYPTISGQCRLYNFGNPYVGNNNPSGPWKLEFVEYYNSSSTEYDDIVSSYAASQYGKSPEQMEVYRLYQWQNGAYQPVAYGVLYAYANENNQVEHAAFFEAGGHYGCYLTGNTHSGGDDFNITFNEDASTGFADLHGSTPTPTSSGDKLSGVFSVSADKAVNFSKGNLQYDSENQIWQFAANQWDYIGNAAGNNAITADGIADNNGIVDLFCWVGASSSLEGIKQYGIISSFSGYGSVAGEALKSDWGNIMGGDWRTLSKDEWIYLLTERTNAANLRTLGTVNGKAGLILMPDGWTASGVALTVTTANYTTNDINTTNWATLEGQGCAFLPAAGCCMLGLFDGVGGDGSYWSSTSRASGATYAHRLHFRATDVDPTDFVERFTGMSVRLVSETAPSGGSTSAGLQVTELQISASWENDQTLVTISDLPGFVAVSLEEAGAWDAVPAGDVVLIYAGTNEGVTATYFHNGAWGDPVPFGGFSRADIFEWASGSKIFYTSGGSTPAVDPAVQNVIDLIDAIPNPVVYNQECYNALEAVYNAYVALSEEQRDQVTNYNDYLEAESRYYMLGSVNYVIEAINDIGDVEFTSACKHRIDYARSEYCNLTLEAKSYVTNYNTLLAAEAAYAALIPVSSTVVWDEAILETIDVDEWGEATYTNGSISLKAVDGRAYYVDDEQHFLFDGSNSEKSFVFSCTSANMLCIEITVSEKHEHNELSCAWQETATGYRWVGEATSVDLASGISKVTEIRFSLGEAFPEPTPTPAQDGDKLPGAFSVSGGKVVYFSKGNLQYLGNIDRWHFAENQWTIIGNAQASDNRDLFSWGTGDNPDSEDYSTYTEWGNNIEGNWRTLTVEEWTYLFNTRTGASNKYGTATVAGVVGLILLPDVYDGTAINTDRTAWDNNVINSSEWAAYEAAGAVFLPAAGLSDAYGVYGVGEQGFYWSSTMDALSYYANSIFYGFNDWEGYWFNDVDAQFQPQQRHSVRLVSETAPSGGSTPVGPVADLSKNIAIDLRGQQLGGDGETGGSKYLIIDSENNYTYVDDEPAAYNAYLAFQNFNGTDHGYTNLVATVPVEAGNYKLTLGACGYGNGAGNVMSEASVELAAFNQKLEANTKCYHQNTAENIVVVIFNVPAAQNITIDCGNYTPYIALEKMAAVPAFTDFEINFRTDTYDMISGAKPEGTVIAGSYHDEYHGYQNVEATVPMQAGNYRLTLGACQFGNGAGNVMSETNAELASFNQNLGENKCYHQDPANNIVSMIFTVDIDQTITIDCGEYTPYMKLEKLLDNTYYINFENAEGAIGTVPGEIAVAAGESWTIPANMTLYKEGYTFVGWSDGVNTYAPGDEFFPSAHGTLHAVYTANTVSVADASTINVKWYFGESNGAPSVTWNGAAGYLLAKGEVDGQMIDLKLDIDATSGKFDNAGRGDKWAQVNANTVFTFPSKEGAVVNVETYSGNETYDLGNGTLTCNTNDYYSYLEIVYPATATAVVIGDPNNADQVTDFLTTYDGQLVPDLTIDRPVKNNMYNTLCLPFHMDADQIAASSLNGVEIYEFVDVDVTNDELYLYTSEEKHEIVAGRPYLVKYSAASQLDDLDFVNVTINNADLDDQAVTIKGVTFKGTFQPVVLGQQDGLDFNGGHLFLGQNNTLYWPNTNNPLKPFRAYFTVNVDAGQSAGMPVRRGMPAHIGGPAQMPTSIENVQNSDIRSQKVIINGTLYIIRGDKMYDAQGQIVK